MISSPAHQNCGTSSVVTAQATEQATAQTADTSALANLQDYIAVWSHPRQGTGNFVVTAASADLAAQSAADEIIFDFTQDCEEDDGEVDPIEEMIFQDDLVLKIYAADDTDHITALAEFK